MLPQATLPAQLFSWLSVVLAQPGAQMVEYEPLQAVQCLLRYRSSATPGFCQRILPVPDVVAGQLHECRYAWSEGRLIRDATVYLNFYATGRLRRSYMIWPESKMTIYWMVWRPYPQRSREENPAVSPA